MKCGGSHIALNADAQTAYELFAGQEENFGDVELLYRAMYHKIGNEVAIDCPQNPAKDGWVYSGVG